jgi:hypothetical protein
VNYISFTFILVSFYHSQAQEILFPSLQGDQLLDKIVEEYKPETVLGYNDARTYMFEQLNVKEGVVEGIYTGFELQLPPDVHAISWLLDRGINTEHIYPRSKGALEENGNAFSDLHHLKPSRSEVNSERLNFPFAEISDDKTSKWFAGEQELTVRPDTDIDEYSELYFHKQTNEFKIGQFEPRESVKGDISRSAFYFYTMYKKEADEADEEYFDLMKEELCNWHLLDKVDENELRISRLISNVQSGKVNPFVLDCSLAFRTYCTEVKNNCETITSTFEVSDPTKFILYPNPSNRFITVKSEFDRIKSVRIYDVQGRNIVPRMLSRRGAHSYDLALPAGLYIIRIETENGNLKHLFATVIK